MQFVRYKKENGILETIFSDFLYPRKKIVLLVEIICRLSIQF